MPPKRTTRVTRSKPPAASSTSPPTRSKPKRTPATTTSTPPPPSSSHTDADILAAFHHLAVPRPSTADLSSSDSASEDPPPVLPLRSVRRALASLALPNPPPHLLNPSGTRTHLSASTFLALARALESASPPPEEPEDEQDDEVAHAFALFTGRAGEGGAQTQQRITLADLRRVARELREEVDEETLRLMIEEANGERGARAVQRGVGREEFEGVMRRAGVF